MNVRKTSFLDLPAELRNRIYQVALENIAMPPFEWLFANNNFLIIDLKEPAILAVSRQIRAEVTPVFYGNLTFQASCSADTVVYLWKLGPERSRMLRNLRAYNCQGALIETTREVWLDVVLSITRRFLRELPAHLHRDALLVPVKEGPEAVRRSKNGDKIVWKRLADIEEFEIVGKGFDWRIWKKSDLEVKTWRERCKDWAREEFQKDQR